MIAPGESVAMEPLLVLIAIAYLVAPIVAFILAVSARNRNDELAIRLARVERLLTAAAAKPAAPTPAPPAATPAPEVEASPTQPVASDAPTPATPPSQPPSAEQSAAPKPTSVPQLATPAPAVTGKSFEENFGTRWTVWVGGLALALGGVFLVRYSIEQGLIGPGVRVFLGALLAAALLAAGEWTRRNELNTGLGNLPAAHIPGILTAAGTTVAYATIYAAYALYGFLSPGVAFVLLGLVALATLAAALLHGPALAGLGLVGAYVTPLLVSTGRPDYWSLYIYLAVVTGAAFVLARVRMWRW